jgi:hypothetical protein
LANKANINTAIAADTPKWEKFEYIIKNYQQYQKQ